MTTISYVCRAVTVRVGLSLADRKTFSLAAPERALPARPEAASRGDARRDLVVARLPALSRHGRCVRGARDVQCREHRQQ